MIQRERVKVLNARRVHLHPTQLFSEVVSTVRAAGLEVHAWDVNDADSLLMMKQLDIPKFDTDNLRLAIQFRRGLDG